MQFYKGVRVPAPSTLAKYGLSLSDWKKRLGRQGGTCGVCHTLPKDGRLVIDHEHVPGYWSLPPEERKKYVRGLVCIRDNHWTLTRYADAARHRQAADYLDRYEERFSRKAAWTGGPNGSKQVPKILRRDGRLSKRRRPVLRDPRARGRSGRASK